MPVSWRRIKMIYDYVNKMHKMAAMKNELDDLLFQRYPAIFARRNLSPEDSCMVRGIECGDGWFDLIDALCEVLQFATDHSGAPQIEAVQVKEKFGTLRFYCRNSSDEQCGMINMAVSLSGRICEECGAPRRNMDGQICCLAHAARI